jgi:hypothetical protein
LLVCVASFGNVVAKPNIQAGIAVEAKPLKGSRQSFAAAKMAAELLSHIGGIAASRAKSHTKEVGFTGGVLPRRKDLHKCGGCVAFVDNSALERNTRYMGRVGKVNCEHKGPFTSMVPVREASKDYHKNGIG